METCKDLLGSHDVLLYENSLFMLEINEISIQV